MIQILSGSVWNGTVSFHDAKPSEMEQSKFYQAIIFLPFHELKPLNILFYITDIIDP